MEIINGMNLDMLINSLIANEGMKLKPYRDTVGKLTIGVGRNLDDEGITKEEALILLNNDITRLIKQLTLIPSFSQLSEPRQRVIVEMAFNLGLEGLMKFKDMWKAIEHKDWESAAKEMSDSLWAKQVGQRAVRLITEMRLGMDTVQKSV